MDWRIRVLDYCSRHPLTLSTIYATLFLVAGILAIAFEFNQTCKQVDLRLWLILMIIRLAMRLGIKLYIEAIVQHYITFRGNILVFHKVIDLLDLFGIIWFAVGNLLIFNNTICVYSIPVIFLVSLSYIAFAYIIVLLPILIKLSLSSCPPSSEADRALLHQLGPRFLAATLREEENARTGPLQLSTEQRNRWRSWLQARGCEERLFVPQPSSIPADSEMQVEISTSNEDGKVGGEQEEDSAVLCSICLLPFASAKPLPEDPTSPSLAHGLLPASEQDIEQQQQQVGEGEADMLVVCYPCSARHVFHADCLKSWLQASYERTGSELRLSCPCCRQAPGAVVANT